MKDMPSSPVVEQCHALLQSVCPDRAARACKQTTVEEMLRVCHSAPPASKSIDQSCDGTSRGASFLGASVGYGAASVNAPTMRPDFDAARFNVDTELSHASLQLR